MGDETDKRPCACRLLASPDVTEAFFQNADTNATYNSTIKLTGDLQKEAYLLPGRDLWSPPA